MSRGFLAMLVSWLLLVGVAGAAHAQQAAAPLAANEAAQKQT